VSFRLRLIVATTAAVALAVVVACLASYFASSNALEAAVDSSLNSAANGPGGNIGQGESVAGVSHELVYPNGTVFTVPGTSIPVDSTILAVAAGSLGQVVRTVNVGGSSFRELILPVRAGTFLVEPTGTYELHTDAAQVYFVTVTGQQHELHVLALRLLLLAALGIIVAAALGYLAAQAALRPLETVTNEIETIAETTDVTYRMNEGLHDELGRLRRVFNRLLNSVEQSQRTQRQLVLDSSHELRTPLTSLRTNAQVLSRSRELSADEIHQITTDMIAQTDELAALITDLAELARGEGIDGTPELFRFDELVEDSVETARTYARTRDVEVTDDLEACSVMGRRDRVVRAVNNLLSNAIKFAPEHGHVAVRLRRGVLVVEDDGTGVREDELPYIFDRFWRSPSARGLPGSGLGLAITNQVAVEMGGLVTASNSPQLGGAQFTFSIPVRNDDLWPHPPR
jgi:two-component system, OmpR family, sensor histidine kinase MprB